METNPLTKLETHFDFGENWANFAESVNGRLLDHARSGMAKLLGPDIKGRSFLEIGCGSGIHTFAALQLGAIHATALDIDSRAVETARSLLLEHAPNGPWQVMHQSVFEVPVGSLQHDIVYSWGALHHTGDMEAALERAASLVKPGGLLAIAVYRKTPMCRFWRAEKKLFSRAPKWYRNIVELGYIVLFVWGLVATGRNPARYIKEYPRARGMTFGTDVRDWLGGYPYESASPQEVRGWLARLGFCEERYFPSRTRLGLLGVGCDEYRFRKADHQTSVT